MSHVPVIGGSLVPVALAAYSFLVGHLEALNETCFCISVDQAALKGVLHELYDPVAKFFSSVPVFVSPEYITAMKRAITAMNEVIATPAWQASALENAPSIARHDPRTQGMFFGYDFHLADSGPRLIEINTNAGGAYVNIALAKAQHVCCEEVRQLVLPADPIERAEQRLFDMFQNEARLAGRALKAVAIVDDKPSEQHLYPEFLLAASVLRAHGLTCVIVDPAELSIEDGALKAQGHTIDLVYNRSTDFYFAQDASRVLKTAYLENLAIVTPHPRAHALYANKANLVRLSDPLWLSALPVSEATRQAVLEVVPRTMRVYRDDAEKLWAERKTLFFKPEHGFGSKATYRGDKLTKATFESILDGAYVAQALVPPSTRTIRIGDEERPLKLDIRAYVYDASVQLFAARLYQGQTTNFRTQGGGFAPVYSSASAVEASAPCCANASCEHSPS